MNYCECVNIFQGCGEIDLPKPEGIAAKWFFIKAGCGNTSPAATLPYGAVSVSPYSGGYPTGYGNHCMNSHSRPKKFEDGEKLRGFAHIQQSGIGAMGYYYNYAVVTPYYDYSEEKRLPKNEAAEPGYYSCVLDDIKCEITVKNRSALHKYSFGRPDGKVKIDFANNGLNIPETERATVDELAIKKVDNRTVTAKAKIEGIDLFFAVKGNADFIIENNCVFFELKNNNIFELQVAISLRDFETAFKEFSDDFSFEKNRENAKKKWEEILSKFQINADGKIKEIFYSNLYHSLVKPADWSGESFAYDGDGDFIIDFNTLWDMYKTGLPLIFMIDKKMGERIVETLLKLGETLGRIPNSFGLSEKYLLHEGQARMLGDYVLLTAYRYGVNIDSDRMLKVIETDVFADNKTDFTVDGKCESNTWMLDMADGCALAAEVAKERGNEKLYNRLLPLSLQWKSAYNSETGLLSEDSSYYEGTLYNYSFRPMVHMDERIALAGGKENFVKLLDNFFGYGQPDVILPTDPMNYAPVAEGMKLGRFEGFNNESDTEAPFSYIYADRHDRLCEVIRGGMKYMFTTGRGGLPGNNDTGALSSYYVLNALGLFPVAGQDLFLIGSPVVEDAKISLFNGNELMIKVENNSDKNIYVDSVKFNGRELNDFRLAAHELLQGGILEFKMK